jgi:hypothetical protein
MKPDIEPYDQIMGILPSMETGIKIGFALGAAIYILIVLAPYWTKYVSILEKRHSRITRSHD